VATGLKVVGRGVSVLNIATAGYPQLAQV